MADQDNQPRQFKGSKETRQCWREQKRRQRSHEKRRKGFVFRILERLKGSLQALAKIFNDVS